MLDILQILTIVLVIILTLLLYAALGPKQKSIVFSKTERPEWNKFVNSSLGKWFTMANVIGTLTSLATAYLFFIGSSKLFGWVIFICGFALWGGSYVTNYFTRKIIRIPHIKSLIEDSSNTFGVIASIFWQKGNKNSIHNAKIIKYISILNIIGVIWLEFSLFSDILSYVFKVDNIYVKTAIVLLSAFTIIYFTIKYGLRGFVFADFFHSPLILLSVIVLLIGSVIFIFNSGIVIEPSIILKPILGIKEIFLFSMHVIFLNAFLVFVTEGHWLRLWVFNDNETKVQTKSIVSTAIIWALLSAIGLLTFSQINSVGTEAVSSLILKLGDISYLFPIAFWIGATAALFSTADTQVYSLLLVNSWNPKSGQLSNKLTKNIKALPIAILASLTFAIAYFIVRFFNIPFEKIIFIIIPMCLNLLPAFVRLIKNYSPKPWLVLVSLFIYSCFAVYGFIKPESEMSMTLAASMVPLFFSLLALIIKK
ncbi:MAG: hypothetical protein PF694_06155 [Bacteroidetes bacterium]|jgi:hypothetical protein|nr:hypothetical protein [Bacteroidota bacterium]